MEHKYTPVSPYTTRKMSVFNTIYSSELSVVKWRIMQLLAKNTITVTAMIIYVWFMINKLLTYLKKVMKCTHNYQFSDHHTFTVQPDNTNLGKTNDQRKRDMSLVDITAYEKLVNRRKTLQ